MSEQVNTVQGTFLYAKVQEPAFKYESKTEKEFSIQIAVDKATAKSFGKQFPKQKGEVIDNDDFKEKYKIDPPYPDQDEQYVIRLKKPAQYNDKATGALKPIAEMYWPKIVQKKGDKAVTVPRNVLLGNGTTGKVSYETNENSYGVFAKLKNILVEKLVKFERSDASGADDFGLEIDPGVEDFEKADDGDGKSVDVPQKAIQKAISKKKPAQEDDSDQDSPF